jgi:NodT family efflux transporter outer membrane factor (OMF) lipoprotein
MVECSRGLRIVSVVSLVMSVAACAVGPTYHPPEAPTVTRYPAAPVPDETVSTDVAGGQAQRFVARDVPAAWWTLFENEALDTLVRQGLGGSPKLAEVTARLVQARENLDARHGATKNPQVDASGSVNTVGVTTGSFESDNLSQRLASNFPLTLGLASVSVSYTLDLFGRNGHELESLGAIVDFERFQLEGARLMLAGNIVTTAIEEASLREQIDGIEAMMAVQSRQLDIVQRLETLGGVPRLDVVAQRGEFAQTRARLPGLRQRLEQTRHRLAVYLGQPPAGVQLPPFRLSDLRLPTELPVSLPSELVRQRPDTLAAEALLRAANARVGVAEANHYPRITLSGTGGAVAVSSLISGAGFALLGASVAQPLFRGGQLKAEQRAAVAAFEQAHATYREVVLTGLQNVADVLVALDGDARTLHERREATSFAQTTYEITSRRYEVGGVSLLTLLDAQRSQLSASLDEITAITDRYAHSAALFQALGGGWWTANPPTTVTPISKSVRYQ